MKRNSRYDSFLTGFIPGIILPVIIALIIFLIVSRNQTLLDFYFEIIKRGLMTHGITICVIPDVILFFVFNRADILKSARGMLGATIFWVLVMILNKIIPL